MTMQGEYAPSPRGWVREQVEKIAETGTTRSVHIMNRPVVLLTMRGVSGKVRKVPLMRVEHGGVYAAVASQGGALADTHIRPSGAATTVSGPFKRTIAPITRAAAAVFSSFTGR